MYRCCIYHADLGYNAIGDAGVTAIAKVLRSNSSLTSLSLRANRISHSGSVQKIFFVQALDVLVDRIC